MLDGSLVYPYFDDNYADDICNCKFNMGELDVRALLMQPSYCPEPNLHKFYSDICANEVSDVGGTNYSLGGKSVGRVTKVRKNNAINIIPEYKSVSWCGSTMTVGSVVYCIYNEKSESPLIARTGVGPWSSVGGTFTIQFSPQGIITLSGCKNLPKLQQGRQIVHVQPIKRVITEAVLLKRKRQQGAFAKWAEIPAWVCEDRRIQQEGYDEEWDI